MPTSSVVTAAVAAPAPPPSAYPVPLCLPVAPTGDPHAATLLAAAYRTLADDLDAAGRLVEGLVADLASRWHGVGSSALTLPRSTFADNVRTLASAGRTAADHLDEYAAALRKAQHHHGWSLGKFLEVGAIVVVTAAVVVVTVGAAAPVGTLAAVEVGEAIAGTEAAAGAATVAEASATAGLSSAGQSMTALRGLTAVVLPHLTQGGIATGLDVGIHLATGRPITATDLAESFTAGLVGSATTTATAGALHATEAYRGVSTLGQAALDTTTMTATLTSDEGLQQYATTGHLDPSQLTRDALLTAFTGGASTLRHPLDGTFAATSGRPAPTGQSLAEIERDGVKLHLHEGRRAGHTISNHVGKSVAQLRRRLASETLPGSASTFPDLATAEAAVTAAFRANPEIVVRVATTDQDSDRLVLDLGYTIGTVVRRDGTVVSSSKVIVWIANVGGRVVVRTAFVGNP